VCVCVCVCTSVVAPPVEPRSVRLQSGISGDSGDILHSIDSVDSVNSVDLVLIVLKVFLPRPPARDATHVRVADGEGEEHLCGASVRV